MKVIFLGTPAFAVPVLHALNSDSDFTVVGVVTQNDKPQSRGMKLAQSEVAKYASSHNLPLYHFTSIRKEGVETLKSLNADIMVTCAYGQLLSQEIIDICPCGIVNVHASLLPKYRGASPIRQAILDGESTTGITLMFTSLGMDEGDMYYSESLEIGESENYGSLCDRLSELAAKIVVKIKNVTPERVGAVKQDDGKATYCKKNKNNDAQLDFTLSADKVVRVVRAYAPAPGSFFYYNDKLIKVFDACVVEGEGKPGEILKAKSKQGLVIMAEDKAVSILSLQNAGGKILNVKDYLNGNKLEVGDVITFKGEE